MPAPPFLCILNNTAATYLIFLVVKTCHCAPVLWPSISLTMRILVLPLEILFLVFGKKGPVLNILLQSLFHMYFNGPYMCLCPLSNWGTIDVIFYLTRKVQLWILGCKEADAAVHTLTQYLSNICLISFLIFFVTLQKKCSSEYLAVKRVHLSRQLSILWQRRTPVMCFHRSRGGGWGYFSFTIQFDTKHSKYFNGHKQKYWQTLCLYPNKKDSCYVLPPRQGRGVGLFFFENSVWHKILKIL